MSSTLKLPRPTVERKQAARIDLFRTLSLLVAGSFGFFLQFDVVTSTFGLPFLRITDGLLFLFLPCLFVMVGLSGTVRRGGLFYFVVLFSVVGSSLLLK